jgi:hypothetical protein
MVGIGIGGEFAQFLRVKDKLQKMEYYLKSQKTVHYHQNQES